MEKTCETCRHDLGGSYNNCNINLEAECAAGEREAWQPMPDPSAVPSAVPQSLPLEGAKPSERSERQVAVRPDEVSSSYAPTRLLTAEEWAALPAGLGWLESMDPEGEITVTRFAWAGGYTASRDGWSTVEGLSGFYGEPFGIRVWLGDAEPTREQREGTPWPSA